MGLKTILSFNNNLTASSYNSYSSGAGSNATVLSNGNYSFNITAAGKNWINNTTAARQGLILRNSNESSASYNKVFHTTEATSTGVRPAASVTYEFPTVYFYSNDGLSNITTKQVGSFGGKISTLPTIYRTGYALEGWYSTSASTGGTKFTTSTPVYEDMFVYARWVDPFTVATALTLNQNYSVNIPVSYHKLYYSFTPTTTGFYTIESFNNSAGSGYTDAYCWMYNSSKNLILSGNDDGGNLNIRIVEHFDAGVTYYFAMGCWNAITGSYQFKVTKTANLTGMIATHPTSQITLTHNENINILTGRWRRFLRFTAPETGNYVFQSYNNSGSTDPIGWVYNSSGVQLAYNDDSGGNLNFRMIVPLTAGQTVYYILGCYGNGTGSYTVKVTGVYTLGKDTYSFANFGNSDENCHCDARGHCFGMSITSSAYHLRILNIANIGGNYNNGLYALSGNSSVKTPICDYQAKQGFFVTQSIVAGYSSNPNISSDWTNVVNYVSNNNYNDIGTLQIIFWDDAGSGHAINFLRYSVVNGQPRIYVYDNNFPNNETYFYKDNTGKICQSPNATYSTSVIVSMGLLDVPKYFNIVSDFNISRVIYANKNEIFVKGVSLYPMIGENRVMFEIPEDLDSVEIIPLVDNATFEYLDSSYSFGKVGNDTIGEFTLSKTENKSTSTKPNLKIRRGNSQ